MKIHPVGAELFCTDRQTDKHDNIFFFTIMQKRLKRNVCSLKRNGKINCYLLTYLITNYILTYLLTYLLRGAKSFLRS